MKLTIGMACYGEFSDVWFTVQALQLYHPNGDYEVLLIDNYGDDRLRDWVRAWGGSNIRYERCTEIRGTSYPRQKVFELARGEFVICMDSHMLLYPNFMNYIPFESQDLIQGVMVYDSGTIYSTHMNPTWQCNMWGVWSDTVQTLPSEPFVIPMHGLGLFGSRKDSWLGFNPGFRGFGGEEGYIHEKYRKAGRKTICIPQIKWMHKFRYDNPPYRLDVKDRIRNYLIGFDELGMDKQPIYEHFGRSICERIEYENSTDR